MALINPIALNVNGVSVPGSYLQAFIKNGDHYFVTEIKVYRDGNIDCWGIVDFDEFKAKVREGWVRTRLPSGARVSMMVSTLNFTVSEVQGGVDESEFVKEVADLIEELNGRPTSAGICQDRLREYQESPTAERKAILRAAYENVPEHMRRFLGDMDSKDWEYKNILGVK